MDSLLTRTSKWWTLQSPHHYPGPHLCPSPRLLSGSWAALSRDQKIRGPRPFHSGRELFTGMSQELSFWRSRHSPAKKNLVWNTSNYTEYLLILASLSPASMCLFPDWKQVSERKFTLFGGYCFAWNGLKGLIMYVWQSDVLSCGCHTDSYGLNRFNNKYAVLLFLRKM